MDKYIAASTGLFGSLKNAVLGNPVTREYQIGAQVASFGPGLFWKVFDGKKKSTGQDVSVFVLEKKVLDSYDKREREPILEVFRKGPQQLAKLRHPRLLTVQHTLEESRDSLAFATEPVFSSLANALCKYDHLPTAVQDSLKQYELYDVEKVYGLLQIAEGLAFLHNDVRLIEGNVTPCNIAITKDGQWKLAGFNFSLTVEQQSSQRTFDWETRLPVIAKPELNYLAPEYVLSASSTFASDMYSFGCLMNAVYNKMKTPFDAGNSITSYKRCIEQFCRFGSDHLQNVPLAVRDHVRILLNIAPDVRPDANQTIKHEFFDDVAAMTLKYLHSLVQRDDMTKSQFFKNLHRVISKLPKRVVHQRIIPHLFLEFPNHAMIPFVLPNVFLVAEKCTDQEYRELILPELKKIFTVQEPVQVLLIFMQRMELLLKKTPADDVKSYVLPMVFRALESPSVAIEELVLSIIPDFAHMIDYSSLKNAIVPRIKNLILKTSALSVRVNALVCIGKIMEYLDKFMMVDDIFPIFPQIPSKEPAVLMAILGIYKKTITHKKMNIEKDYLATKAIPFLLPIAIDPGLNLTQFNNFMSVIREMLDRVDQEHRTKLEQLNQMQEQQKSALEISKTVDESNDMKEMMAKVDKLVLGSPDKSVNSTGFSEFSKIFGIVDESVSSGRSQQRKPDLMAHHSDSQKTTASTTRDLTQKLPTEKPYSSSTMQSRQTLGSASNSTYKPPAIQQGNNFTHQSSYSSNGSASTTAASNRDNQASSQFHGNHPQGNPNWGNPSRETNTTGSVPRSTQNSSLMSSVGPASSRPSQSLMDSMMMKNASLAPVGVTSSTMGVTGSIMNTAFSNASTNSIRDTSNVTLSQQTQSSSSLNSILTPEMKHFSSMQQKMPMNSMSMQNKPAQGPPLNTGMQQSSMAFGVNQMSSSSMQGQQFSMQAAQQSIMGGGGGGFQQQQQQYSMSSGMNSMNQNYPRHSQQTSLSGMLKPDQNPNSTSNNRSVDELQNLLI